MSIPAPALVEVAELAAHINDPEWRIFDCRHDLKQPDFGALSYAAGHLPGALFLHLDRDLSGPMTGRNGRHPLPGRVEFAQRMGACGVGPTTRVVAYDQNGGMFAARLWWLLRWLGHAQVSVLNGGLPAWQRAGQALETALAPVSPAQFTAASPSLQTVDTAFVLEHLQDPQMLLLDARSPDRFRGENETLDPFGGHIPGAVNRCFLDNLDARSGCFKSPAQLRREYAALLGAHAPADVVQQCGSGVTACHNLLAMDVAGLPGARLYPGSWSEWCADPVRPRATGPV